MKLKTSLLILIVWLATGCATKVVSIYNDAIANGQPSSFLLYSANDKHSLSEDNQALDNQLQTIISKGLELKGLKSSALPDIYVSYIINIHTSSNTQKDNYSSYYRYNYDYNYPYNYTTRNYKEGLLIIDIRNDDNKLIWQGSKTFKIRSKQSVNQLLTEICREIIATYNIEGKR